METHILAIAKLELQLIGDVKIVIQQVMMSVEKLI